MLIKLIQGDEWEWNLTADGMSDTEELVHSLDDVMPIEMEKW